MFREKIEKDSNLHTLLPVMEGLMRLRAGDRIEAREALDMLCPHTFVAKL